ncbi:hypothetical protein FSP39_001495 [Pinctada imbricata]|uniref:protein-tyrosine-phosphatase n=1 Tax=Pinctada imbricata TaxID=66713 RepID=A0AA88YU59_PINIB|nr:hypothetical protein FSP39_001495 [Pinctada imbricata]
MIWENGSSKIVMLANLVELGKNKCEQYWPNEKQEKINVGTYDIIMQNEKLYGAYNVRELLLKYKETREQRKVVQFHFTTWPDHGTADAIQLAIFQHVIDCKATQNTGPMVVHCSAGIGRTGTYIALDAMTKWIRNHSKVDVYSFVSSMRNNRMNMIQTVEQYIVLHEAMLEAQLMTNSAIKREDYGNVWRNISKSDFPKNEGRCRKEFQKLRLALSSVDDDSINEALSNQNKSKNRDEHIIPIRIYRPFLSSNLVKRSNYINAVVLPSMKANVGMIATQYPTPDTVQDFYSLIYDHVSPTIVILEPNEENVPLLPENKQTSVYGVVNVSYKHGDSGKDFNERKLELRKKDDNETKQVDVIECTSWPWRQSLPSSPFVVLSLIQRLLQTSHGEMQSSYPITIVCFNGATECGLFCSLFDIIESLSDSGEVDILRHVRQLQIRRPEFISESAQYEFLYDAVNDHLEQANIYANV